MSTFSSVAATGAAVAGAGTETGAGATTTGAATTGAGAAVAVAGVVEAADFLADFLGAVAELDICILMFGEVFAVNKRGNDDVNSVSESLNFVRIPGEKVASGPSALVYFSHGSYSFLSNRKVECPNGTLNVRTLNPRNWKENSVRMLQHTEIIVEFITKSQCHLE